jgi:hypothetical protein
VAIYVSERHAAPLFRVEVSRLRYKADYTGRLQDGGQSDPQEGENQQNLVQGNRNGDQINKTDPLLSNEQEPLALICQKAGWEQATLDVMKKNSSSPVTISTLVFSPKQVT